MVLAPADVKNRGKRGLTRIEIKQKYIPIDRVLAFKIAKFTVRKPFSADKGKLFFFTKAQRLIDSSLGRNTFIKHTHPNKKLNVRYESKLFFAKKKKAQKIGIDSARLWLGFKGG